MILNIVSTFSNVPALFVTVVFVLLMLYYYVNNRGLPSGPIGLPYFGLMFSLKEEDSHLQMDALKEKYGDIFSFRVTGQLYINLGTAKLIREAHVSKAECFNRTTDFSLLSFVFQDGVAFLNGENWKVQRKFFTQAFKEYGMITLRDSMAGPIYDQVQASIEEFRASEGEPVNITQILTDRCCSIIRQMLFGEDGISQKELLELNEAYEIVLKGMTSTKLLLCGGIARRLIVPMYADCRKAMTYHQHMLSTIRRIVEEHEANFNPNHIKNVIDSYIKERKDRLAKNDPTAKFFTNESLASSLIQFVGDGVLTVSIFIGGFLQSLVQNPECQEKMYQEIANVLGTERLPTLDDKSNLPYVNAFLQEVIRCSEFFPMFPSLQCTKETTVKGYRIPKGAITILNSWSANHEPLAYNDPYEFDPSRFITQPGKQRAETPLLFGVGKRSCAGEAFTMMQAFLFLTATVQNFKVCLADGGSATKASIFYEPEDMKLILKPRHPK